MAYISQYDVLCGKDKTYESHEGNRIYREMIVAVAPLYAASTSKQDKMRMTSDIVSSLLMDHGSRFMKMSSIHGGWEEINIAAARDKTSHALRFCASHMTPSIRPSSVKRRSKPTKERRVTCERSFRHKVSFDEGTKKNTCVSPEPQGAPLYHSQGVYQHMNTNHHDMNIPLSSWYAVPDIIQSVHDLSNDNNVDIIVSSQKHGTPPITPYTYVSPNIDIDTFDDYDIQDDDEFALIFEEA